MCQIVPLERLFLSHLNLVTPILLPVNSNQFRFSHHRTPLMISGKLGFLSLADAKTYYPHQKRNKMTRILHFCQDQKFKFFSAKDEEA